MNKVRVRFAPSPTGPLHIGGARSALFNYLIARQAQGEVVLRFEDTDQERSSRESEENIMAALSWLGIDWDEGVDRGGPYAPYRQTERIALYQEYTRRLLEQGWAYRCYCAEEELEEQRRQQMSQGRMPRYTGKCRDLTAAEEERLCAEGRRPVIRFRVPDQETIVIDDLVRGTVTFASEGIGDFIIVKSDGLPTYNFAVVVDDAEMKITHIVRGEEHLSNTPRQVMLYQALKLPPPRFAHISLILGEDRSKMSKRHGTTAVMQYKENGYLPEALLNFLALLGWAPEGEDEIFSLEELIRRFSLDRVAKNPAVFDVQKLNWLNGYYIRHSSLERIVQLALPFMAAAGYLDARPDAGQMAWLSKVVAAVKDKLTRVADVVEEAEIFVGDKVDLTDAEAKEVLLQPQVADVLNLFLTKVEAEDNLEPAQVKQLLKSIGKDLSLGGKQVFMPVRVALTGQTHGPELHELIPVLGKGGIKQRVSAAAAAAGLTLTQDRG